MDWYLGLLRYRTCIWCKKNFGWCKNGLDMQNEVHQKYIRYIVNARCWLTEKSRILAEKPYLDYLRYS
jgi:hypothetical protein